jgi:hypothetical protein
MYPVDFWAWTITLSCYHTNAVICESSDRSFYFRSFLQKGTNFGINYGERLYN